MLKAIITTIALYTTIICPAFAQGDQYSAGATGAQARQTGTTAGSLGWTQPTGPQSPVLPRTSTAGLAAVPYGTTGLPPTRVGSFVQDAGGQASDIYGNEGTNGPPPINGFNRQNRIDIGIQGEENKGLTTGHEDLLPSAWGPDEFIGGPEMSISGDHVIHNGQGGQTGYSLDPGDGLPGGVPGGAYYDPSGGVFPGSTGL